MKFFNYEIVLADKAKDIRDVFTKLARVKKSNAVEKARPDNNIPLYYDIYRTDSIVGAAIDYTVTFILGAGMVVTLVDENGAEVKNADFDYVVRKSKPRSVMSQFLKDALVSGDGYIYKLYSGDRGRINRFDVLPATQVRIHRDGVGTVEKYVQELGEGESDYPTFGVGGSGEATDVVHYRNRGISGEAYGRSDVEPVTEVAEILRDMIIDLANFISTKAYSPLLWQFGSTDKPWSAPAIEAFMNAREEVEPGDQIGVQGDIKATSIGVGSNTLDIEPYLKFFASMEVTGLRIPATLTSVITDIGQFTADSQTNAYARRVSDMRADLSELLEVELFDDIITTNGYGNNLRAVVSWKKHDDESLRLAVNNIIQLIQNGIISTEEARVAISYPAEPIGTLPKSIDNPEGATPAIDPAAYKNTIEDTSDDDMRTEQKRQNA